MKAFCICLSLLVSSLLFAAEPAQSYRHIVDVNTLSNGKQKSVYTTINKEKKENKIVLVVTHLKSGDIEIRSEKFKLGKMPFSSSFKFIISQADVHATEPYSVTQLAGTYKVAASKTKAFLTGTISSSKVELELAVTGMGKNIQMQLSYQATDMLESDN